ncbi:jmjC domain, hydroxylase domain-containing protein [Ditylenchus destructor]|nr:jmjC domain, hydroxylase domain-containing protein [Ditylenchus destructor]
MALERDVLPHSGELLNPSGSTAIGIQVPDSDMDQLFYFFCAKYSQYRSRMIQVGAVKFVTSKKWAKENKGDLSTLYNECVPVTHQKHKLTERGGIFVSSEISNKYLKTIAKNTNRPEDFPENIKDVPNYMWQRFLTSNKIRAYYATSIEVEQSLCKKLDLHTFRGVLDVLKGHEDVRKIFGFFGTFGSVFCCHTEDFEAFSVNILLDGAPKYWLIIAAEYRDKFNQLLKKLYDLGSCPKPVSHFNFLVAPSQLQQAGIRFTEYIQYPGEIMIIMPGAHHCGFNLGVNYSENVYCGHPAFLDEVIRVNNICCTCVEDDGITRKHRSLDNFEMQNLIIAAKTFEQSINAQRIKSTLRINGVQKQHDYDDDIEIVYENFNSTKARNITPHGLLQTTASRMPNTSQVENFTRQ